MGQAPQPRAGVRAGMGGQTGSARGGFRVRFRVNFQRYRLWYLTTVVCSENRPKAGINSTFFRSYLRLPIIIN